MSGATWSSCRSQARLRPTYSCVRYQVGREPGIRPTQLTCPNTDTDHTDQTLPVLFARLFLEGRRRPGGAPRRPAFPAATAGPACSCCRLRAAVLIWRRHPPACLQLPDNREPGQVGAAAFAQVASRHGGRCCPITSVRDIHVSGVDMIRTQHAEVGDSVQHQMLRSLRLSEYPKRPLSGNSCRPRCRGR